MSSLKISELELLIEPAGLEQTVVIVNGLNKRVTLNSIKSLTTKADIGLALVDNTSDINKPISTAVQNVLINKSNIGHIHAMSDVQGLIQYITTELNALGSTLSAIGHIHQMDQITGLVTELSNKATIADLNNLANIVTNISTVLNNKAATIHTHNASEIAGLTIFAQALITNALVSYSTIGHSHEISQITNLNSVLANKASTTDIIALSTLITALQASVLNKANIGHTHSIAELINFTTEVQNVVSGMNLSYNGHTHTASQITNFNPALITVMRDIQTFMNVTTGTYDVLPHAHIASQIQGLQSAILTELTITNLQSQVTAIVNTLGLAADANNVAVGVIQW